ncbi:OmpA family protein [Treponema sp. OMZ 840]|uniref:OmpA family protein n=1 Tax=Treponema sp. OMZ 840 TaxID=244313 RepID=UPI003D93FC95
MCAASLCAQTKLEYRKAGSYWMVERSDLRRYDNGKYTGLTSREVRSFVYPSDSGIEDIDTEELGITGAFTLFEGGFYVGEKTMSNLKETALSLDTSVPARFALSSDGRLTPIEDRGFPTFRSFPAFPSEAVQPGDTWTSDAVRAVDPLNKGIYTRMPIKVLYTFQGEELYKGRETYRIQASWATRYGMSYIDSNGDADLIFAAGSHTADMYVLKETGQVFVIADRVEEEFRYKDGNRVQFKGSILLFTDFPSAVEKKDVLPLLENLAGNASTASASDSVESAGTLSADIQLDGSSSDTVFEQTPAGLRLSLRNIGFLPDSTDFRAEEKERLDRIAEVLKQVPDAKLLIEGHAASTGRAEGEKKLSAERAQRIADELAKRGIKRESCITKGHGSQRPIASNETEEGKRQNRRVEITILE